MSNMSAILEMKSVLVLIWWLSTILSPVSGCLLQCSCDETKGLVKCDNIQNLTFHQVLQEIPSYAKEVRIANPKFRQPTVEELETQNRIKHLQNLVQITVEKSRSALTNRELELLGQLENSEEMELLQCGLEIIHLHLLKKLKKLLVLNLSHNTIYHIDEYAFNGMPRLRVLILHNNTLQFLPTNAFQELPDLEIVDLSHNAIKYIHPMMFHNLTNLKTIYLEHNELETMHDGTFTNISETLSVYLKNNLWDCNCGIDWLISDLAKEKGVSSMKNILKHWETLTCHKPKPLAGLPLFSVKDKVGECSAPMIDTLPENVEIFTLNDQLFNCSAIGFPSPSVYWKTPAGIIAHPNHRKWLSSDIPQHRSTLWFAGQPTYYNSTISALENGSLVIKQFRYQFAGEYTCLAVNPVGIDTVVVNVTIETNISHHMIFSVIVGFGSCFGFLMFGIIIGVIRMCAEKTCKCCQEQGVYKPDITFVVDTPYGEEHIDYDYEFDYSPFSDGTWPRFTPFFPHWSPYHSPKKCVTPAEVVDAEEKDETGLNIRDTLEDVRYRLRQGIERASGRIKNSTATVKENTSKKLQNFKESTSHTMQTIRESGTLYVKSISKTTGDYAHRVRIGVALGVHQMKSQVQSVKELCGTGNIAQTISVATVTEGPTPSAGTSETTTVADASAESNGHIINDTIEEESPSNICSSPEDPSSPVAGPSSGCHPLNPSSHVYISYADDSDCYSDDEMVSHTVHCVDFHSEESPTEPQEKESVV